MALLGTWDVLIKTPIGTLSAVYEFSETNGALAGSACSKGETTALYDLVTDGSRVTWRQSVTKPMRLNLGFDIVLDGDEMTGHSRAGRLPRSTVTGNRRHGGVT